VALIHFGRKSEGVKVLVEGVLPGVEVDEHEGLGVAPQAVLQQVCQLRVPVRDVRTLLGQCHDNVAEV